MSVLLLWAWLFTLPGLLLTALGVGKRPGVASLGGPAVMLIVALAALANGAHADFAIPNWLPFLPDGSFSLIWLSSLCRNRPLAWPPVMASRSRLVARQGMA